MPQIRLWPKIRRHQQDSHPAASPRQRHDQLSLAPRIRVAQRTRKAGPDPRSRLHDHPLRPTPQAHHRSHSEPQHEHGEAGAGAQQEAAGLRASRAGTRRRREPPDGSATVGSVPGAKPKVCARRAAGSLRRLPAVPATNPCRHSSGSKTDLHPVRCPCSPRLPNAMISRLRPPAARRCRRLPPTRRVVMAVADVPGQALRTISSAGTQAEPVTDSTCIILFYQLVNANSSLACARMRNDTTGFFSACGDRCRNRRSGTLRLCPKLRPGHRSAQRSRSTASIYPAPIRGVGQNLRGVRGATSSPQPSRCSVRGVAFGSPLAMQSE